MPLPVVVPPYVSAEYVLQLVRTLCLDAGISIRGSLLSDAAPGVVITAASQTLLVVTITTAQAHGLNIGDVVNVQNVTIPANPPAQLPNGYNGLQTVQTIPALNQFTYILAVGGLGASSGGSVSVSPSQAFIYLNSAYQYVQARLANEGYETPVSEAVLLGVTAMPQSVMGTASQVSIGYDTYFDGLNNNTPAMNGTPILPVDLLIPKVVKNRQGGTFAAAGGGPPVYTPNNNSVWFDMGMASDGLTKRRQVAFMQEWEWRNDRLYMIGATQVLDLWIRYESYFPELTQPTDQVKIFRGANAIAYTLANRFSNPRGGDVGGHFVAERDDEIRQIVNRTAHKNLRKQIRRQPYGGGHASGWENY